MKKKFLSKTVIGMTAFTIFCLVNVFVGSVAWFVSDVTINVNNGTGQTDSAYFAYGTGTQSDPFGIADTRHLNNLAWLQYNGNFNDKHYYFELANDINEGGTVYTIPPIGTEDYPFIGVFNGNGYTVNNIKVTNYQSSFSNKPENISYNANDAEIVGFFGVVGELDDTTYSSSVNALYDVTLNNITVESKTSTTLIGLAAGYVNAEMSGVKISGTVTIDVNGQVSVAKTSISTKLTDYGLVGHSKKTASTGSYSQDISKWYDSTNSEYGGTDSPTLGGNMDVRDLFSRLNTIKSTYATTAHYATKQTQTIAADGTPSAVSTENITSSNNLFDYEDNANQVGSFCFAADENDLLPTPLPNPSFVSMHLTGRRNVTKEVTNYQQATRMVYFNSEYYSRKCYVYPVNNTTTNIRIDNDSTYAWTSSPNFNYGWHYTNASFNPGSNNDLGALYTEVDGVRYYFKVDDFSGTMRARQEILNSVPSASNYLWHIESAGKNSTDGDGNSKPVYYLYSVYNSTKYYIGYNANLANNAGKASRNVFVRTEASPVVQNEPTNVYENYDTYLPLITESSSNYSAKDNNTGYIISGSDFQPSEKMTNSGTMVVSWFSRGGGSATTYDIADTTKASVRTIYGGTDDDVLATTISQYSELDKRYEDFSPSLNSSTTGNKFYSLKFNESRATISASDVVAIPNAILKGEDCDGYEFPRNSISFSLAGRGHTAFFAGTFVGDSGHYDSFFSLHKINRSGATISSIEEIYKIYKHKTNDAAAYLYETSADSPDIPSTYELVFDTEWITNPDSITNDSIYYFEIPLNAGDYALGPVPLKNSAHLMYLDIGTSGAIGMNSITGHYITSHNTSNPYPLGVDFAVIDVGDDGGYSMCVSIESGKKGLVTFAIQSQNIAITNNTDQESNRLTTYTYQGSKFSNESATGKFTVSGNSPNALPGATSRGERIINATVNQGGNVYSIVVTDTLNNLGAITDTAYSINGASYASLSAVTSVVSTFTSDVLTSLRNIGIAVTLTRVGTGAEFKATPEYTLSNRKNVIITLNVTGVTVSVSNVTDYSIYKGSVAPANAMTNGNSYTFN